jgi:hypothetical protein
VLGSPTSSRTARAKGWPSTYTRSLTVWCAGIRLTEFSSFQLRLSRTAGTPRPTLYRNSRTCLRFSHEDHSRPRVLLHLARR